MEYFRIETKQELRQAYEQLKWDSSFSLEQELNYFNKYSVFRIILKDREGNHSLTEESDLCPLSDVEIPNPLKSKNKMKYFRIETEEELRQAHEQLKWDSNYSLEEELYIFNKNSLYRFIEKNEEGYHSLVEESDLSSLSGTEIPNPFKNKNKMKFTHRLSTTEGWDKTNASPSDFKEAKHLGKCALDGDMFVAYSVYGEINIFKGVLEDEKLKTNFWYKDKNSPLFVYRTGDDNNYGIENNVERNNFNCSMPRLWQEATDEEVKEALEKLAKKKGFKNIDKLKFKDPCGTVFEKGFFNFVENNFRFKNNILSLDYVEIFKNGKWAKILEEKEPLTILNIEERLKRLEDKLL